MSNAGKGVISLDFYDLDVSPDGISLSGFSQGNSGTWQCRVEGKVAALAKKVDGVEFLDLKARDNKEMAAFAAAAAAIARIRDDKARAEVKMHHLSMFQALTGALKGSNSSADEEQQVAEGMRLLCAVGRCARRWASPRTQPHASTPQDSILASALCGLSNARRRWVDMQAAALGSHLLPTARYHRDGTRFSPVDCMRQSICITERPVHGQRPRTPDEQPMPQRCHAQPSRR